MNRMVCVAMLGAASLASGQSRPTADSITPLAIGETFTLRSEVLKERRRINIYLPAGYTDSDTARFPVLYMPDGGLSEDFLHVAGLLQVSAGNGTMRPFILVGVENTERRRDMTGPTEIESDKRIAPRVGGSASFRSFFRAELMPMIRARYRTTSETAIVGESLAGLFVVETLLTEPDLFDTYMAFDPSLWWNGGRLVRDVLPRLGALRIDGKSVFLATSGDAGLEDFVRPLSQSLESQAARRVRVIHEGMPTETHATIYHPAALRAFRALLAPTAVKR